MWIINRQIYTVVQLLVLKKGTSKLEEKNLTKRGPNFVQKGDFDQVKKGTSFFCLQNCSQRAKLLELSRNQIKANFQTQKDLLGDPLY